MAPSSGRTEKCKIENVQVNVMWVIFLFQVLSFLQPQKNMHQQATNKNGTMRICSKVTLRLTLIAITRGGFSYRRYRRPPRAPFRGGRKKIRPHLYLQPIFWRQCQPLTEQKTKKPLKLQAASNGSSLICAGRGDAGAPDQRRWARNEDPGTPVGLDSGRDL